MSYEDRQPPVTCGDGLATSGDPEPNQAVSGPSSPRALAPAWPCPTSLAAGRLALARELLRTAERHGAEAAIAVLRAQIER